MDALIASYGDASSDSDDSDPRPTHEPEPTQSPTPLPPPPLSLLHAPNSSGTSDFSLQRENPNRVRSFPHVEGNFALHVYIPVTIPLAPRKETSLFVKRVASIARELHAVDIDIPLINLIKDEQKFDQIVLGREFHVSLGRTVPIRVHQRDSMVAMLRQRLQSHRRYWIDFNKWEVFVNDDHTRTFLSVEVTTGGLAEIKSQIEAVNEVYRLHNLPEFYKDPRPHISIAWAVGDISDSLKKVVGEEIKKRVATGDTYKKRFDLMEGQDCLFCWQGIDESSLLEMEP
ncbi:U6 snrna phosphodiesterase [Phtheirospermum japonicum]|uniref:U6 snRNA phosphodiesterase n=1 Tax=Phtheirospermum japonicum TaxID=374723 RepID=A0A830BSP3_9LAMI|nr:U6 snrna phosphodiesterase [Phtheirospermum japonicum]